jgi:hypothetical protein
MSTLERVGCVQISGENLSEWWTHLIETINNCHFVALDLVLNNNYLKLNLFLTNINKN